MPRAPQPLRDLLAVPALAWTSAAPPRPDTPQGVFVWHAAKVLHEDACLLTDVLLEAEAPLGKALFAVDVVLEVERGGRRRRVAIECDGAGRLRDHARRTRRDAALVASGAVDAVYRLRGADVLDHVEDVLYLVAAWEASSGAGTAVPDLFSARGRVNLATLATREARHLILRPEQAAAMVVYTIDPESEEYVAERRLWHATQGVAPFVLLRRFDRRFPAAWAAHAAAGPQRALRRLRPTG